MSKIVNEQIANKQIVNEQIIKYLSVKTNILIKKLGEKYKNILIKISLDIPDQIIIKLNNWKNTHIYLSVGNKNEESCYIVYSDFIGLKSYGILANSFNTELDQIFKIINFINIKIEI